jgi:hypothetical protein
MTEKKVIPKPTTNIWTEKELKEEFAPMLLEQAKFYNANYEWEQGWALYPNHRGEFRLVVFFDPNYVPRSIQCKDIDPAPKCWTVVCLNKAGKIVMGYGWGERNYFETIDEAREEFGKTALEIERSFNMAEVTKLTPRRALCGSCMKTHDWDEERQEYFGMWEFQPHREFDSTYDGCRGWD